MVTLTLNEEACLAQALDSVSGSRDIVVVDAGSTDKTVAIAESLGARVITHAFLSSAAQRQWVLENVEFQNPWVWILDADEWVTIALARELRNALPVLTADGTSAGWARFRVIYQGRWIPRASLYPTWTMRLIRLGRVRYEDRVANAVPDAQGKTVRLRNDVIHEDLKPFARRFPKLDRYAKLEAIETQRVAQAPLLSIRRASSFRRKAKIVWMVLPGRSLIRATYLALRGGMFEGKAGWHFIEDSYFQERMTVRYLRELRKSSSSNLRAKSEP